MQEWVKSLDCQVLSVNPLYLSWYFQCLAQNVSHSTERAEKRAKREGGRKGSWNFKAEGQCVQRRKAGCKFTEAVEAGGSRSILFKKRLYNLSGFRKQGGVISRWFWTSQGLIWEVWCVDATIVGFWGGYYRDSNESREKGNVKLKGINPTNHTTSNYMQTEALKNRALLQKGRCLSGFLLHSCWRKWAQNSDQEFSSPTVQLFSFLSCCSFLSLPLPENELQSLLL